MSRDLIDILRNVRPSGPDGFEGLVALLLEALTGQHFNLAASGSQAGRDMSSSRLYSNVVAVECKRYSADTELSGRELLAELVQAAQSIPDLDTWVLVASREVPSQLEEALRRTAEERGVHYLSISSGDGSPSSLEALCTYAPDIVKVHPGVREVAKSDGVLHSLRQIANHPLFQQRVEVLRAAFSSALVGFGNWRKEQNRWFVDCLTSDRKSRANFGQPINVADREAKLIKRASVWGLMSGWLESWRNSHWLLAVLGEEGDGKTWSVSSWLLRNIIRDENEFPAVVFLPSTDFNSEDPSALLSRVISRRLRMITDEHARQRLDRWMSRQCEDTPLILLVLDGINERGRPDSWRRLLEQLADDPWYGRVAMTLTSRTAYWQRHFAPLRHLSVSSLTIPPYDERELDVALAHYNLSRENIQSNVLPLIRKPRYFDLMIRHRSRISESGDITVARLVYEDWRDRFERKQDLPLTDEDFQNVVRRLAQKHQDKSSRFSEHDIESSLPVLTDRQRGFQELITSGLLRPHGDTYLVDERLLVYGLGLLLVDQIERAVEEGHDLRELIAGWMEPHAEIDIKAAICEFAALHSLSVVGFPREAKAILLQTWIDSRNTQQDTEDSFTAYLPIDPESYVALAEAIWSDTYNNPWAQELLIRSYVRWSKLASVIEVMRSAFERWLGFVHINGFTHGHDATEKAESARNEIKLRIGRNLQLGPFSYADHPFTAIQDDGQLRLGRAALAVISYLPRRQFVHAIAIGCVAEAIMGQPDKYDLFAWTIRSSPEMIWLEIEKEVRHLLRVNNLVAQQAAYRLMSFEGGEEAFRLRETLPDGIFPSNPLAELSKQDPCGSGFSWRAEDCAPCLQRDDLALDWVARQVGPYCINPDLPMPDRLKSQFGSLISGIDANSLWTVLATTESDFTLESYEPVLAAYAPYALADLIRTTARQISDRQGVARRQLSIALIQHYLTLLSANHF